MCFFRLWWNINVVIDEIASGEWCRNIQATVHGASSKWGVPPHSIWCQSFAKEYHHQSVLCFHSTDKNYPTHVSCYIHHISSWITNIWGSSVHCKNKQPIKCSMKSTAVSTQTKSVQIFWSSSLRECQCCIFPVSGKKIGELSLLWLMCIALASPNVWLCYIILFDWCITDSRSNKKDMHREARISRWLIAERPKSICFWRYMQEICREENQAMMLPSTSWKRHS